MTDLLIPFAVGGGKWIRENGADGRLYFGSRDGGYCIRGSRADIKAGLRALPQRPVRPCELAELAAVAPGIAVDRLSQADAMDIFAW